MKFERTTRFDSDFVALPVEHQLQFRNSITAFHEGCIRYIETGLVNSWPRSLRVRPMASAPRIWEMTWSFSGPDGRATFEFVDRDGAVQILWRRIGNHAIYKKA